MKRRALLQALPLIGIAPAAAAVPSGTVEAQLDTLIANHRDAVAIDNQRWDALEKIEEGIAGTRPFCRVQTSRLLGLRNDDGTDNWTPIYSYTVEAIEKVRDDDIRHLVRFHCWGKGREAQEQQIREKRTAWADGKIAELQALEAERKRIEDESGYTAALASASASADAVRDIERAIVAMVPDTLTAAAKKAGWIVRAYRGAGEGGSYLSDIDDVLLLALETIGPAGGQTGAVG